MREPHFLLPRKAQPHQCPRDTGQTPGPGRSPRPQGRRHSLVDALGNGGHDEEDGFRHLPGRVPVLQRGVELRGGEPVTKGATIAAQGCAAPSVPPAKTKPCWPQSTRLLWDPRNVRAAQAAPPRTSPAPLSASSLCSRRRYVCVGGPPPCPEGPQGPAQQQTRCPGLRRGLDESQEAHGVTQGLPRGRQRGAKPPGSGEAGRAEPRGPGEVSARSVSGEDPPERSTPPSPPGR